MVAGRGPWAGGKRVDVLSPAVKGSEEKGLGGS